MSDKDNMIDDFISRFTYQEKKEVQPIKKEIERTLPGAGRYDYPRVPKELREKIERLKKVTQNLEKNTKTTGLPGPFPPGKYKIDYYRELNRSQFLGATTINGPVLIIAGAGTGKTRTVVYRVAFMLENEIPPENILLLTFTRKAANEMNERVQKLLGDTANTQINGGTFHALANLLLRKYAKLIGLDPNFTIIDMVDSQDIIDLIRREMKFVKKERAFPRKNTIQAIISKARNCDLPVEDIIKKEYESFKDFIEEIEIIGEAFGKYKKANHLLDYDDLLEVLYQALSENEHFLSIIIGKFKYIMVDEFQDTNIVQKRIVDLLASKHKNIMVVGDDAQSIYSFRGAHFENILTFPETYPDCTIIKIEQNYRSQPGILNFSNDIINNAQIGYKKELFTNKEEFKQPQVKRFFAQEDEAEWIVDQIMELSESGVDLNAMAVLYRAGYHSNYIQAELVKRSIPYVVYGGIKFAERRHVKDLMAYLRIAMNPLDAVSWNRVLKLIPGVGNVTASKLIQTIHAQHGKIDFSGFKRTKHFESLTLMEAVLNQIAHDDMPVIDKIEALRAYYIPILKDLETDWDRRLGDLDVLVTMAMKYKSLDKFLSDFALDPPSNKFQNRNEPEVDQREDGKLILSTIHSSKGLEWGTVFVPHLLDGLFPSTKSLRKIEDVEEERRLFYVACTRAKNDLFLTMPSSVASYDAYFTIPSRFLAEVSRDSYKYSLR